MHVDEEIRMQLPSHRIIPLQSLDDPEQRDCYRQFVELYHQAFQNPSIIEDPGEWIANLAAAGHLQPSCSFLQFSVAPGSGTTALQVLGGIVFDYFPGSATGLVSYLVTRPDVRGKGTGIARELVDSADATLKTFAQRHGQVLQGLFAETEPLRLAEDQRRILDQEDVPRLRALAGLGFHWIDVPYVQPALSPSQQPEAEMLLLLRPVQDKDRLSIRRSTVQDFLRDYYGQMADKQNSTARKAMLDAERAINIALLKLARDYIGADFVEDDPGADRIRYGAIPTLEKSTFAFTRLAVTLHVMTREAVESERARERGIAVDEKVGRTWLPAASTSNETEEYCPYFNAFEKDIVSHLFHATELFQTICWAEAPTRIRVHFPDQLSFDVEGLNKTHATVRPSLPMLVNLTYTRFAQSGCRVWHISFRPDPAQSRGAVYLTENDVIKLINLTPSAQERATAHQTRFEIEDGDHLSFGELFHQLTDGMVDAIHPCGSTTLVDPSQSTAVEPLPWRQMFSRLHTMRRDEFIDPSELANLESLLEHPDICALAGIVDGIFEFNRVDAEEALDMLTPVIPVVPHILHLRKGHLTSLSADDLFYDHEVCQRTIGNNPYLIITHGVVLHNLLQLEEADRQLGEVERQTHPKRIETAAQRERAILALAELDESIQRILNRFIVPNVFLYKTERAIYNVGLNLEDALVKRSLIEQKMLELRARHERLLEESKQDHEAGNERYSRLMNGMLAAIAVLQAFNLFNDKISPGFFWSGIVTTALLLAAVWLYLPRRRRKSGKPPG